MLADAYTSTTSTCYYYTWSINVRADKDISFRSLVRSRYVLARAFTGQKAKKQYISAAMYHQALLYLGSV